MKVYLYQDGRSKFYGSISALCLDLGLSVHTLYKHDFKLPYLGKDFKIEMGTVLTIGDVKKTKLPEIKTVPIIKEIPKQTNLKVNILPNTFVIKTFGTFINIDGEVLEMDTKKPYFEHKGKKYNLPKKTFGDIETLLR